MKDIVSAIGDLKKWIDEVANRLSVDHRNEKNQRALQALERMDNTTDRMLETAKNMLKGDDLT